MLIPHIEPGRVGIEGQGHHAGFFGQVILHQLTPKTWIPAALYITRTVVPVLADALPSTGLRPIGNPLQESF
jgi:hypothetical protein